MSQVYIAVGPMCWGKGNSERKAVRNCLKNWITYIPKTDKQVIAVYLCSKDTYVNELGGLSYPQVDEKPVIKNRCGAQIPASKYSDIDLEEKKDEATNSQ